MNKTYNRINWENYPSDKSPVNAQNLNKIDVSLDEVDNRVITLDTTKATKEEVAPLIKEISFNESNGIFTITRKDGSKFIIDTKLEKIAVNFTYDPTTQQVILTLIDGTTQDIDLSALITEYEFLDTDTVSFFVDGSGKVSAIVKEGSIEEKHLRPNYLAEIKVEVAKAESAAASAEASKVAAAASASTASNKASEASASATSAANSASTATQKATEAITSATNAANSASTATAKANAAEISATNAANSATNASNSATTATNKANAATTSATNAAASATDADTYAKKSQSYAVGTGNVRPNEATDNAKYYAEKAQESAEKAQEIAGGDYIPTSEKGVAGGVASLDNSGKVPKSQLPSDIENVTGVKGDSEQEYRIGNVNLTPDNIGALSLKKGGTVNNNLIVNKSSTTNPSGYVELEIKNDGKVSILRPEDSSASAKTNAAIYADKSLSSNGTRNDLVRINAGQFDCSCIDSYFGINGFIGTMHLRGSYKLDCSSELIISGNKNSEKITLHPNGTVGILIEGSTGDVTLKSAVNDFGHTFKLSDGGGDSEWIHFNSPISATARKLAKISLGDWLRINNDKIRIGSNYSGTSAIQYDFDDVNKRDSLLLKSFNNGEDNTSIQLYGNSDYIHMVGRLQIADLSNPARTLRFSPYNGQIEGSNYHLFLQNMVDVYFSGAIGGANHVSPSSQNVLVDLGDSTRKWRNIYATNGTIQTSDRNEKNTIEDLAIEKAEALIYGLKPSTYKMNEGTSGRTHWGMISQDIEELLEKLGWTSEDFAGFIKSPKQIEITEDENGNKLKEPRTEVIEGEYLYSLRYDEFIAPLIKVVQAQNERISELENKILELEKNY